MYIYPNSPKIREKSISFVVCVCGVRLCMHVVYMCGVCIWCVVFVYVVCLCVCSCVCDLF